MKKVAIITQYPKNVDELFKIAKKSLEFVEEIAVLKPVTSDERRAALEEAQALITNMIGKDELDIAKNLGFVQVPFAGVDTFDLEELFKRGILLANVHSNATSVAEFAFSLLISLAKDLVRSDRDLRKGYWHGWMGREQNLELQGKTVCIVGFGSIGKEIGRLCKAFGMNVIGVKRTLETVPQDYEMYAQDNLLKAVTKADFVVSVLPLTKETRELINRDVFNAMSGKYFINVGRGLVVKEDDLFVALKNRVLKGAAIDTWWAYPAQPMQYAYPSKYPFWELDNIIMTSHAAGYSDNAVPRMWEDSVLNVVRYLKGEKPENLITEKGY